MAQLLNTFFWRGPRALWSAGEKNGQTLKWNLRISNQPSAHVGIHCERSDWMECHTPRPNTPEKEMGAEVRMRIRTMSSEQELRFLNFFGEF